VGRIAYGGLFASGWIAVAPVSFGPLAIGVLAWGGLGVGVLAFGALSLGVAATGGGAVGYVAYGGGALGWLGASGGVVVAHHFALGGGAMAERANDPAAVAFMRHNLFFRYAEPVATTMILLSWLSAAGPAIFFHRLKRRHRALAAAG